MLAILFIFVILPLVIATGMLLSGATKMEQTEYEANKAIANSKRLGCHSNEQS